MSEPVRVIPFERVRMRDLAQVGGKNASLGEMIGELASAGIRVPGGFATTADAFREFLEYNELRPRIEHALASLDVSDVRALTDAGRTIRSWVAAAKLPPKLIEDVERHYRTLVGDDDRASFAVRSSAT
ncbi:MAG: PEP/pyruvate-binding domain-containing protein, partial [Betaproteobacteria bacterium]